jgi:hypothetical protein
VVVVVVVDLPKTDLVKSILEPLRLLALLDKPKVLWVAVAVAERNLYRIKKVAQLVKITPLAGK